MKKISPTKRNAEQTMANILRAAQQVFHEKGYDAASTREIAGRAGINVALIARYFGSKMGLFERAILPYLSLEHLFNIPNEDLPRLMAERYTRAEIDLDFDPFMVLLRSMPNEEIGQKMMKALEQQALAPLADKLKGEHAKARALLITSQLAGLIFALRILGLEPDAEERTAMQTLLYEHLDNLINPA